MAVESDLVFLPTIGLDLLQAEEASVEAALASVIAEEKEALVQVAALAVIAVEEEALVEVFENTELVYSIARDQTHTNYCVLFNSQ